MYLYPTSSHMHLARYAYLVTLKPIANVANDALQGTMHASQGIRGAALDAAALKV